MIQFLFRLGNKQVFIINSIDKIEIYVSAL